MNTEIFKALDELEAEKKIKKEYMLEKITQALSAAYKRDHSSVADNVVIEINQDKKQISMFVKKEVVEEVYDPDIEISLEEAQEISKRYNIGDFVQIELKTKEFGRIAAQTAKQVIIQGIREAERGMLADEFSSKEHEILTAVVSKIEPMTGNAVLEIGINEDKRDLVLQRSEQIKGEQFTEGEYIKIYVAEVRRGTKGPQVVISRTHPGLVKRLFELEVPEISDGTVLVHSIAREAGNRTKIAVSSADPNVGAVGACIGPKRSRINNILKELKGEKIDIIEYSENPAEYISAALAPASVVSVSVNEEEKSCEAVVPADQLSLAIGKEGQNARLAARLTGYKIDIHPDKTEQSAEE